jgi:hypothetical protein
MHVSRTRFVGSPISIGGCIGAGEASLRNVLELRLPDRRLLDSSRARRHSLALHLVEICTQDQNLSMTRIHHGPGIQCIYPENWQLTEDSEDQTVIGFTLQSPNTAFMTVFRHSHAMAPADAIDQMKEVLSAEYDEVDFQEIGLDQLELPNPPEELVAGDVSFYYLDLIVTARLVAFTAKANSFLVHFQAEDREFESLKRVFQAMLISMLATNLPANLAGN